MTMSFQAMTIQFALLNFTVKAFCSSVGCENTGLGCQQSLMILLKKPVE